MDDVKGHVLLAQIEEALGDRLEVADAKLGAGRHADPRASANSDTWWQGLTRAESTYRVFPWPIRVRHEIVRAF